MRNSQRLALLLGLCLLASSCAPLPPRDDTESFTVIATVFASYDFARHVGGEEAEVSMLLPPAAESHHYEPTVKDIAALADCDVFLRVGGGADAWTEALLQAADNPELCVLDLVDCVPLLCEEEEGHEHDHGGADGHVYDTHVWTAPKNAALIVERIAETFCTLDEENAEAYRRNAEAYQDELVRLDGDFTALIENARRDTIVFGDRFPLRYFTESYGLHCIAAFPGCAEETEPTAEAVTRIIDAVRAGDIPVVFRAELSDGRVAQSVRDATGAAVREFHSCHNISREDFERGEGYVSLMRRNYDVLREALY